MKKLSLLSIFIILSACDGGGGSETPSSTGNTGIGSGGGGTSTSTPINISFSSSDDSVEIGTIITLTWQTANADSCSASGTWNGSKNLSGSEDLTIEVVGYNRFTLTCTASGSSRSESVEVEGYRVFNGVSVDGYIRGADIFVDQNENYEIDSSESFTTSDNNGSFENLIHREGNLISLNGFDLPTGTFLENFSMVNKLSNHNDFLVVTPITSIAAFMESPENINDALGLDSSIIIDQTDPVAEIGDNGIYDYLYEKGNQLSILAFSLQNAMNSYSSSSETTQDYFKAIAEELENTYSASSGAINIEAETFIDGFVDRVVTEKASNLNSSAKNNLQSAMHAVLPVIEVKNDSTITTAIQNFAFTTLQNDIKSIATGEASTATVNSYQNDIYNYIANDQNITVEDLNKAPVITSAETFSVDENQTAIGTVTATDEDNDTLIYSLSGTDAPAISIGSSGVMSFITAPNYEIKSSYEITANVTDQINTSSQAINININDVNDPPVITSSASYSAEENQTAIGTVTATDEDNDTLIYSLSGTDQAFIDVNSSSGVLTFTNPPDYEAKNTYSISVNVSDGSVTANQAVSINVTDIFEANNPPIITSAETFSVDENQTSIGTVTATDAEGDALTYSLSGSDASAISIDSNGVMTFNEAPDYETKSSYSVIVNVSDGISSTSQDITININDLLDGITGSVIATSIYSKPQVSCDYTGTIFNSGNTITGYTYGETLTGTSGNDIFNTKGGSDYVYGSSGTDKIIIFDDCSNYSISTLSGVTKVIGGSSSNTDSRYRNYWITSVDVEFVEFSDSIAELLTSPGNAILGNSYGETINGSDNDDVIDGNGGSDYILGGDGVDTLLVFDESDDSELITLSGVTKVIGGSSSNTESRYRNYWITSVDVEKLEFKDKTVAIETALPGNAILGNSYGETINGSDNDDVIDGNGGSDQIDGKGGDDRVLIFDESDNFTVTTVSGITEITGESSALGRYRNYTITATNIEKIQFKDKLIILGRTAGAEIQANGTELGGYLGDQTDPKVVVLNDGKIVVLWAHQYATNPSRLKFQVFTSEGVKIGGEKFVSGCDGGGTGEYREWDGQITELDDDGQHGDRFAIVWSSDGSCDRSFIGEGHSQFLRVFNEDGTVISGNMNDAPILLDTNDNNGRSSNGLTANPAITKLGVCIELNDCSSDHESLGNFVVHWYESNNYENEISEAGEPNGIGYYSQRFDINGERLSPTSNISKGNSNSHGDLYWSSNLTEDNNDVINIGVGNLVHVWELEYSVRGTVTTSDTSPLADGENAFRQINNNFNHGPGSNADGYARFPRLASLGNTFILAYRASASNSYKGIFKRCNVDGCPYEAGLVLSSSQGSLDNIEVARLTNNQYIIVYERNTGRQEDAGSEIADGSGSGIEAKIIEYIPSSITDNLLKTTFVANSTAYGYQGNPDVAATSDGGFVVVWEAENQDGDEGGDTGIFMKIYK